MDFGFAHYPDRSAMSMISEPPDRPAIAIRMRASHFIPFTIRSGAALLPRCLCGVDHLEGAVALLRFLVDRNGIWLDVFISAAHRKLRPAIIEFAGGHEIRAFPAACAGNHSRKCVSRDVNLVGFLAGIPGDQFVADFFSIGPSASKSAISENPPGPSCALYHPDSFPPLGTIAVFLYSPL